MIRYDRLGGRSVELFLPFTYDKRKVTCITFAPIKYDHTLSWRDGKYANPLALMAAVSGETETLLRELRYPDADRVMAVFIEMLPPEIRETFNMVPLQEQQPAVQPEIQSDGFQPAGPSDGGWQVNVPPETSADPTGLGVELE
jgi:hypothetical protein